MKFYTSVGPNPRVVAMFIAEKGIDIESVDVDILAAENRKEAFLKKNPGGQSPALELDDGSFIAEITVICDYLEDRFPDTPLIGTTAEEKAVTRMWCRRVDLKICEPMANGFRWGEGYEMFKERMFCAPEASDGLKAAAQDGLQWLDKLLTGPYIAGDRFTLADVLLFCFLDFGASMGQPINPELANIGSWLERMRQRASVEASVHPSARG